MRQRSKTPNRSNNNTKGGSSNQANNAKGNAAVAKKDAPFSMYRTNDVSQVKVNHENADFYGDQVDEISKIGRYFNVVKEFKEELRIDPSVVLRDLSLKVRASEEDEAFAKTPELWINFRRGNTLLEIYDPKDFNRLIQTVVARKGLNKFFDINYNFISREARYREDYINGYQTLVKNMIFAPLKKAMLEGHKVEVITTLKANGENTQISFVPSLDAWSIASKNVGMIVRNVDDIQKYENKNALRYSFAVLFAKCWFTLISQFKKKDLENLKQDFSNRTFIGEYIGNPACQHLVKYSRETIVFYAVVDNLSKKICRLPEEAYAMFKKYKLDVVRITSMGLYNDYDHMCDDLQSEFERVSGLSIREEEEGMVIYFVLRHKEDSSLDEVLSLGKLKTLEYRLFRKMREKLRDFASYSTNATSDVLIERFIKQSRELCRDPSGKYYDLPHPLDFYIDICVLAFQLISRGPKKEQEFFCDLLVNEYVHFLEEVLKVFEEQNRTATGKAKGNKYIGKVDFLSTIVEDQSKINYTGPAGQRFRQVSTANKDQVETPKPKAPVMPENPARQTKLLPTPDQPEKRAVTLNKVVNQVKQVFPNLGNNIVIFIPAFTLDMDVVETLKSELGNLTFIEADYFQPEMLQQHSVDNYTSKLNLIFINSLRGIENEKSLMSHTEKIYYFVVNYEKETVEKLRDQDFEEVVTKRFSGGSTRFESPEELAAYIDNEIQLIESGVAIKAIKQQRNVEVIKTDNYDKDLVGRAHWAQQRLNPTVILDDDEEETPKPPTKSVQLPRKVTNNAEKPAPALRNRKVVMEEEQKNNSGRNTQERERSQSESKKKVKINDVPEYAPQVVKQVNKVEPMQFINKMTGGGHKQKTIIVIMPVGIPGMGKSTFVETQLKPYLDSISDVKFVSFSSDAIRKDIIDETMSRNKAQGINKSRDQVFQDTGKRASQVFLQTLDQKIYEAIESQSHPYHVICLDKNHPPSALSSTVESINKFVNSYSGARVFNLVKVALVPQMNSGLYQDYPFSLSFLLQCFLRCLDRSDHETLTNSDPNMLARIQLSFFKAYKGIKFDPSEDRKKFLQNHGLDEMIRVPLTLENPDVEVPYNVQVCLDKCLKLTVGFGPAPHNEEFDRLVHLANLYKSFFGGLSKVPETSRKVSRNGLTDIQSMLEHLCGLSHSSNTQVAQNTNRKIVASTSETHIVNQQRKVVVQQSNLLTTTTTREVTKKAPVVAAETTQYRVKPTTPAPLSLQLTRQDSFGKEEDGGNNNAQFQLNLDRDDNSPKFAASAEEHHSSTIKQQQQNTTHQVMNIAAPKQQRQVTNTAGGPSEIEFETLTTRKDKQTTKKGGEDSDDSSYEDEEEKLPLYLGISLHEDKKLTAKMREMLPSHLEILKEQQQSSVMEQTVDSINQIWLQGKQEANGWRKADDFHVTTYYVGRDEDKTNHDLYKSFQPNVEVPVEIVAFVVVPNKIVTGICFPQHDVANRCPHVTLMINEWKPAMSNSLLEESCIRGTKSPFSEVYEELKLNGTLKEGQDQIVHGQVKVEKNGPSSSCYFVTLNNPVVFEGLTKIYE